MQHRLGKTGRGRSLIVAALCTAVALGALATTTAEARDARPGAPGIGDRYYPRDGNGGYDVRRYALKLRYEPDSNQLDAQARIRARATESLSRFNLDLNGLDVHSVRVQGRPASFSRRRGELTVRPHRILRKRTMFRTVVRYDGRPRTIDDLFGLSGFLHTDDGTLVAGQPHVASYWFPANDHPADKAAYSFRIRVPNGLVAVANGVLESRESSRGWTTWSWDAKEPMASYLATATIGQFDLHAYRKDGLPFWDAVDPDLFAPVGEPRTGSRFAISGISDSSYKRLRHHIEVPASGAELSFSIGRDTEPDWDYVFVEARGQGVQRWTTLRELNGHTSRSTGRSCPYWLDIHPFLKHYQAEKPNGSCAPRGTTGTWWAASGDSDGMQEWSVDLSRYAGDSVDVSITQASDDSFQHQGAVVDDIVVSTGEGTTSFEADGDPMDGWTVPGPPRRSPGNDDDWFVGTVGQTPPTPGEIADGSLARQGQILRFLSRRFGDYPFSAAGGIVDDDPRLGFALENQTRPVYARDFFVSPLDGDLVVVHELAHQWYGDSLAVRRWRNIWLNEGLATYAEWMWLEREDLDTARQLFRDAYQTPARDSFWNLRIGDPGPRHLFDDPVYTRGAMTVHRLRTRVGDQDFFSILQRWTAWKRDANVTTGQFHRLAEHVSGRNLDRLFHRWLFTGRKPRMPGLSGSAARSLDRATSAPLALRTHHRVIRK